MNRHPHRGRRHASYGQGPRGVQEAHRLMPPPLLAILTRCCA